MISKIAAILKDIDDTQQKLGELRAARRPVLLVIEDDPTTAEHLGRLLKEGGTVLATDTLESGMAVASRHPVNVILLDLNLPDSSGIQTARSAVEQHPEVPVVVITGDEKADDLRVLMAGAQELISKADAAKLSKAFLYDAVNRALARHKARIDSAPALAERFQPKE